MQPFDAFLALWNGRAPERDDYDVWHTREHVPERLSVPGILSAIRYDSGKGPLPEYFTFYRLANAAVLDSAAYQTLLRNPSPWSRDMRPDFRRFLRVPCVDVRSVGGGVGGYCVTAPLIAPAPAALLSRLAALAHTTAVHGGAALPASADVPFAMPLDEDLPPAGVLVIEGFSRQALVAEVTAVLAVHADIVAVDRITSYALAFALLGEDAADIRPFDQADARHMIMRPA